MTAPVTGAPDYSTSPGGNSVPILVAVPINGVVSYTSAALDLRAYKSCMLRYVNGDVVASLVTLDWYADAALTELTAGKTWVLGVGNTTTPSANLGPYAKIIVRSIVSAQDVASCVLTFAGSNVEGSPGEIGGGNLVFDVENVAVAGGGATVTIAGSNNKEGPLYVYVDSTAASWSAVLERLNNSDAWVPVTKWSPATAASPDKRVFALNESHQIVLTNNDAGVQTFNVWGIQGG